MVKSTFLNLILTIVLLVDKASDGDITSINLILKNRSIKIDIFLNWAVALDDK